MAEILHKASHCGPIGKFGINLGYIWDLFGIYLGSIWDLFRKRFPPDAMLRSTILKCFQNAHIRHITHRAYTPKLLCFNPIRVSL